MFSQNNSEQFGALASVGKKLAIGFMVIMVLGAIVSGGYLIFGKKNKANDVASQVENASNVSQFKVTPVQPSSVVNSVGQEAIEPTPLENISSPATVATPVSPVAPGWKTYQNNYFKISFSYPESWTIEEQAKSEKERGYLDLSIRPSSENKVYRIGDEVVKMTVDPAMRFVIFPTQVGFKDAVVKSCSDPSSKSCIRLAKSATTLGIKMNVECDKNSNRRLSGNVDDAYIYAFSTPNMCASSGDLAQYPAMTAEFSAIAGRYIDVYRAIESSLVVGR